MHDEGGRLALTAAGEVEVEKLRGAVRAWLARELADWGADDEEFDRALASLATKFVEQEPQRLPGAGGLFATAG